MTPPKKDVVFLKILTPPPPKKKKKTPKKKNPPKKKFPKKKSKKNIFFYIPLFLHDVLSISNYSSLNVCRLIFTVHPAYGNTGSQISVNTQHNKTKIFPMHYCCLFTTFSIMDAGCFTFMFEFQETTNCCFLNGPKRFKKTFQEFLLRFKVLNKK